VVSEPIPKMPRALSLLKMFATIMDNVDQISDLLPEDTDPTVLDFLCAINRAASYHYDEIVAVARHSGMVRNAILPRRENNLEARLRQHAAVIGRMRHVYNGFDEIAADIETAAGALPR
jgi:hypothetical protein